MSPTGAASHPSSRRSRADPIPGLPPGFWFAPRDEDMVAILERKVRLGRPVRILGEHVLRDVDVSVFDPEGLPRYETLTRNDVSYFFTTRTADDGAGGEQPIRLTPSGRWKGVGRVREVRDSWYHHQGSVTGFKKIFYHYKGKTPEQEEEEEEEVRTCWVMKELRMNPDFPQFRNYDRQQMESCVLCKVYDYVEEEALDDDETSSDEDD